MEMPGNERGKSLVNVGDGKPGFPWQLLLGGLVALCSSKRIADELDPPLRPGKRREKGGTAVKENPAEAGGVIRGDLAGQEFMVPPQKTSVVRIRIQ